MNMIVFTIIMAKCFFLVESTLLNMLASCMKTSMFIFNNSNLKKEKEGLVPVFFVSHLYP